MSAPAEPARGGPTLVIRGRPYPVLLPKLSDPRLHLAAVITSLQVLGQVAFHFSVSIAQILISLATCALLEVAIAAWRQRVILWPASAMLTGNGVAFVLRVPGTQHGDWWSLRGWWIYVATAGVSLLSKHLIQWRGSHVFNPSNFGLLLCFLLLGRGRAAPLDFWWGPMSPWMALALAIIVAGGLAILFRVRLIGVAIGFWLAFAASIAVVAGAGHAMTARWHLGPVTGAYFWWALVTSPELLVFMFFMITDPRTTPKGRVARVVYGVGIGLLATLLIAPQRTEFGAKVALLGALAIASVARPLLEQLLPAAGSPDDRLSAWAERAASHGRVGAARLGGAGLSAVAVFAGLLVLVGLHARPVGAAAASLVDVGRLPRVTILHSSGVSSQLDRRTATLIAGSLVADLRIQQNALLARDERQARAGLAGAALLAFQQTIGQAKGSTIAVPAYRIDRVSLRVKEGEGQGPPTIVAGVEGAEQLATYTGRPPRLEHRGNSTPFTGSFELGADGSAYLLLGAAGARQPAPAGPPVTSLAVSTSLHGLHLQDVAAQVGLNFRQDSFRYGMSSDYDAMMGGGVCWLDYNNDGWEDLFVVNSYSDANLPQWEAHGGLPRTALFENVHGKFRSVGVKAHADLAVQGDGCAAADLNGDGYTDIVVTTTHGADILWNNGNGTFREAPLTTGPEDSYWYTGVAVADVNGDGRPDVFLAGYTDLSDPVPNSTAGFPTDYAGVRDLLFLNEGPGKDDRSRFREVGAQAGLEAASFSHGLGAVFLDYNGDGRPDLYVANDEDPNQLYENVPWPGGAKADPAGLGFRFEERGAAEGVADPYAGMGVAAADDDGNGRIDLFVTNARREPSSAFRRLAGSSSPAFANGLPAFDQALGAAFSGWGASWVDLANSGSPDLVLAAGAIPVTNLSANAEPVRVLAPLPGRSQPRRFGIAAGVLPAGGIRLDGRGLAAADVANNGRMYIAINTIGGRLVLLRSTGPVGHWLEVESSPLTPGTTVTAVLPNGRRLMREVQAGSSYLSSEDPRLHFGLGGATTVKELIVRFPFGGVRRLRNVRADRIVVVRRPAPAVGRAAEPKPGAYLLANCRATGPGRSTAEAWDETAVAMLRDGNAAPTVAARDLFHLSAAMWDAWAAYDPTAEGYFGAERARATNPQTAREAAISYAAYRLLVWRASFDANLSRTFGLLTERMRSLCYSPDFTSTAGTSPAALGNRIAAAAIAYGQHDGSLEALHYADPSYVPQNAPMVVSQPGSSMHDPTFWQPLALGQVAVQGLAPEPAKVQSFVGAQWGGVRGFALPAGAGRLPIDPGPPPTRNETSAAYRQAAVGVIRVTSESGKPGVAVTSPEAWNVLANTISDSAALAARVGPTAADRLRWDVRLYFALNGALHDAAIAASGAERFYQSPRPISMIRYMAFEGQSSDPTQPSYSAQGLPLVPGLIELITRGSSAPGQPLAALAADAGQIAVRTHTGWVLGTRWTPGRPTPPSPGWVSGESAFAFAADEVLTPATGRSFASTAVQAGRAGVEAGTEIAAADLAGRKMGAVAGKRAWSLAQRYFAGTARPG